MNTAYWVCAVLLIVGGIAGTVAPILPGAVLVYCGLLMAAWLDSFQHLGGGLLKPLAFLSVLSFFSDFVASAFRIQRVDGTYRALIGAAIGLILGLFLPGLPGLAIAPFIGAAIGEYYGRRQAREEEHIGLASWFGWIAGTAAKMTLAFFMMGIFLRVFVFKR